VEDDSVLREMIAMEGEYERIKKEKEKERVKELEREKENERERERELERRLEADEESDADMGVGKGREDDKQWNGSDWLERSVKKDRSNINSKPRKRGEKKKRKREEIFEEGEDDWKDVDYSAPGVVNNSGNTVVFVAERVRRPTRLYLFCVL
jgi:hypothetical protein